MRMSLLRWTLACCVVSVSSIGVAQTTDLRYDAVRELQPIGYWPADEGTGRVLHDRSGHDNHGRIFFVPWENGLLNFTGAFHWVEMEGRPLEQLTIGGWLFSRHTNYRGYWNSRGMLFFGNMVNWNPVQGFWGDGSFGLRVTGDWQNPSAREGKGLEVFNDGRWDVLGSMKNVSIQAGKWHHIVYTYQDGVGKLYLDGELVQSRSGTRFRPQPGRLFVGVDARWWMVHPGNSRSLDGSVRDLVLFDRALSDQEIVQLKLATTPQTQPAMPQAGSLVLDGRRLLPGDLDSVSAQDLYRALQELGQWSSSDLQPWAAELLPILEYALQRPATAASAVRCLLKLQTPQARDLRDRLPDRMMAILQNPGSASADRAAAALVLVELGPEARRAVAGLLEALDREVQTNGVHLPRVEDLDRNALMAALLKIAPEDPSVRSLLGRALAEPLLQTVDLHHEQLKEVRALLEDGQAMDALTALRSLNPQKLGFRFLSQGAPELDARGTIAHDRAYTPATSHQGVVYRIGSGRGAHVATRMKPEEFESIAAELRETYPEIDQWATSVRGGQPSRAVITRITPDGQTDTAFLEGEWFIFLGGDKRDGWSIGVDEKGYIHIAGGLHNIVDPRHYMAGTFERIGLPRDPDSPDAPSLMYWVSREPGSIHDMEFVGQRSNPRSVPLKRGLNYMNFVRDREGRLYLYGRIIPEFKWSWGMYRYDADSRRWQALGGSPRDVIESATSAMPSWAQYLVTPANTGRWEPTDPVQEPTLVWSWQPHFYDYIRDWGVKFDPSNRMYIRMSSTGLTAEGRVVTEQVFAYSDDGGQTLHRADGTRLTLPMTINPGPGNANINDPDTVVHRTVWLMLLEQAGYTDG